MNDEKLKSQAFKLLLEENKELKKKVAELESRLMSEQNESGVHEENFQDALCALKLVIENTFWSWDR